MRFTISIADLVAKPHNAAFENVARTLAAALVDLGHEVVDHGGRLILFGANDIDTCVVIPTDAILFNAEQIVRVTEPQKLIARTDRIVWDYAQSNVDRWHVMGVRAVHCPIGYHSAMETIRPAKQDVDVLFYGTPCERRREVLDALREAGIKVTHIFGSFGLSLDRWIARSKIVLNLHYYDNPVFEIFRVSHLLANAACVVTEDGGRDEGLETLAMRACAYASREKIVETCHELLASERLREAQAEAGYEMFKRTSLTDSVRKALDETDRIR